MPNLGFTAPPAPIDKREGGERHTTMRLAQITLPDGDVLQCVIRDLSQSGAKVGVSKSYVLPEYFALTIVGQDVAYPVRRVWRRGDFVGVTLVPKRKASME